MRGARAGARRPHRHAPAASAGAPTWAATLLAQALLALMLSLVLSPVLPTEAEAAELVIEAPAFSFDRSTGRYTYHDGRLQLGDLTLTANVMVVDTAASTVDAEGAIRIESPQYQGTAQRLHMTARERTGTLYEASLFHFRSGLYLDGQTVHILPDGRIEVQGCTLTTCPADEPGWSVRSSEVTLLEDDVGAAWNPILFLGPVPVFWFPWVSWPITSERRSGVLLPHVGLQSSSLPRMDLGFRLEVPIFLVLGLEHDLTLTPDYIARRNLGLGAEYNYAFTPGQQGRLTLWGLREGRARDPADEIDILPAGEAALRDPFPKRFYLDWSHNQALGAGGRLTAAVAHSSDGQVRREYARVTEYRPFESYQVSGTWQGGIFGAALTAEQRAQYSAESLYADRAEYSDLAQRPALLPRLTLDVSGRPVEAFPLGFALEVQTARFVASAGLSGRLGRATPEISLPVPLGGAVALRASWRRHLLSYSGLTLFDGSAQTPLPDTDATQDALQVELRTDLARVWRPESGAWAAIKHRITPRLVFEQVQDVAQPHAGVIEPERVGQRLVSLRLDNTVLLRRQAVGGNGWASAPVREALRLNLVQRYDLRLTEGIEPFVGPAVPRQEMETAPGQPLLPLRLETELRLDALDVDGLLDYHHQQGSFTRGELALHYRGAAQTLVGLGYNYTAYTHRTPAGVRVPQGHTASLAAERAWSERFSLGLSAGANLGESSAATARSLESASAFFDFHPTCYRLRVTYREQAALSEVDRGVFVLFELTGLAGGAVGASGR